MPATTVDSLISSEFAVEIDGKPVTGMFRVLNLVTFKRVSGSLMQPSFSLTKTVQHDSTLPMNVWLAENHQAVKSNGKVPTRDITIKAVDDGKVIRVWAFKGCFIDEVRYSDFDTSNFQLVEEIITISYKSMDESFS
jgi:hypothetical protein